MTSYISKTFLKGLGAILPIVVTLYLIYWLANLFENLIGPIVRVLLPFYFPGLGLMVALGLVFLFGVLMQAYLFRALFNWSERLITRLPGIKVIHGAVQDLLDFIRKAQGEQGSQVVMVTISLGETEGRLLGFVTREDFDGLPQGLGGKDEIAVYMPMSYQIGGYTVFLPRDRVQPIDMPIDQAMRFAVTAGMSTTRN
ncbi:MAG: DUF502 domain-containing protein [Ectothiorhodospiraceae bacterium]|nr:DUF502 domain-containing protein [Ectothiorhodospiraceae bacterium]